MPPPFFPTFTTNFTTTSTPSSNPYFNYGYIPFCDPTNQYALSQIKQIGSVLDYYLQFDTVSQHIICMSVVDHLVYFIYGLRDDIRNELLLVYPRPFFVSQAFELAQKIETKLLEPKASVPTNLFFPPTMNDEADVIVKSHELNAAAFVAAPVSDVIANQKVIINELLASHTTDTTSTLDSETQPLQSELLPPNPVVYHKNGGSFMDLGSNVAKRKESTTEDLSHCRCATTSGRCLRH